MEGIGFIINIVIAVSLAMNAKKHSKNPILWGILSLLFGLITLGIYLIQIGNKGLGWVILIISILFNLLIVGGSLLALIFLGM